jgi:ornithine cyclodeaminase/alanine dehydrogenase-like protein (mu-crystallin family)
VDAVGSFRPATREVDTETVKRARRRGHLPRRVGGGGRSSHPDQGARHHAAPRPDEITLFKSVGWAPEDAVSARLAYDLVMARGIIGTEVTL